jgi:pyruvate carboxylase subunit B
MSRSVGRVRITLAGGPGPSDVPRDLEVGAVTGIVTSIAPGRVAVRGADGALRTAWIGETTALPGGATRVEVVVDGWRFELEVEDSERAELRRRATRTADAEVSSEPAEIRAIIPGRVQAVRVAIGDVVELGQTLLVVEAMKMQNELRATRPGRVERLAVGEGDTLDAGDLLLVVR